MNAHHKGGGGQYLAGLWAGDIFRGLLWCVRLAHWRGGFSALSWSWAKFQAITIKHIWPANATVHAELVDYTCVPINPEDPFGLCQQNGGLIIKSSLLRLEPHEWAFSTSRGSIESMSDITVKLNTESGDKTEFRIRYYLDYIGGVDPGDIYALKITGRVSLLLQHDDARKKYIRIGLIIVAKPDAYKWKPGLGRSTVEII
jgi:hypothetical protein